MNFIEYLFIFISFCLIFVAFDLVKDYTKAKLMKNTVKDTVRETIDVALATAFRSLLNYKQAREDHKAYMDYLKNNLAQGDPEFVDYAEESKEGDEIR
ncbi:MAG TPA: hypothetical protein VEA58_12275 [Anaerovoracaceae bacterium]|nr:hypothetical protein [Anaerovoracaceae bacterium]